MFRIKKNLYIIATALVVNGCTNGHNAQLNNPESDSVALTPDSEQIRNFFSKDGELTWDEIANMDSLERRRFYLSLTDSITDLWRIKEVDATSYAVEDSVPSLPADEVIHLYYRQKVNGFSVSVEFIQSYDDLNFGKSILTFSKQGHTFQVFCDEFSDEQLIAEDTPYVRSQKAINLTTLKPGAEIYLNYVKPKINEYLSESSPFYFKDMDFDGEEELVVNNLQMGDRGYNTYDVFKVFNVKKPQRLKGLPFTNDLYKITNYNVEYEPQTQSVLDKRYDGFDAYGHYRYKSIPACGKGTLQRVFILEDAEDLGFYHPKDKTASDSVNLIQPYKKYERVNGKIILTERGVYEQGNYGWNYNEIVLEKK